MKNDFMSLVADLEESGSMLSREEVERKFARDARQERLDRIRAPVTAADAAAIADGTLTETKALTTVRRWLSKAITGSPDSNGRPMRFLVLLGAPGRGKTVAASWALAEYSGYYVSAGDLRRMTSSFDPKDRSRLDDIYRARLVVLDDLGSEAVGASSEEAVFDFVNARQVDRALTIVTGNLTGEQLKARYSERVVDRLTHQGFVVELIGDNLRRTT